MSFRSDHGILRLTRRLGGPAGVLSLLLIGALAGAGRPAGAAATDRRLVLFYTAEVHGTVEPCGCTSDPLGDISRLASVMADARRSGASVGLVDAGGLMYPEGSLSAKERPSADLRAAFLAKEMEQLGLIGAGVAETDLAPGAEPAQAQARLQPKRLASNITGAGAAVRAPVLQKLGAVTVGVLGVADPAVAQELGGKATDMTAAVQRDADELRKRGAELIVLLAPVDKNSARKLARDTSPDIVVLGKRVGKGMARAERGGRALLVASADELQRVGRLEIVLRGPATPGARVELADAGGPDAIKLRRDELARDIARLEANLKSWTAAGGASGSAAGTDASFVAAKKRELADLQAEQARLNAPWAPPPTGSYVVDTLIPLRRSLRRDPTVASAMKSLDKAIAASNLKQATPPPPAEPGRASYVGIAKCAGCHKSAVTFWNHTVHAQAWKTLVDGGKQADYKCVGCHVTGFGQVGGSTLGFTKKLESVQCEVCHGPGSLHVLGEGNEEPLAIKRAPPETVCLGCHTEQHSDTFAYVPYLRDIVGPGHGAKQREQLGPGKTGHELRSAALAQAKLAAKP